MSADLKADTSMADRIRQVLLHDWDPSGAEKSEAASGTYDSYIGTLSDLIASGADEEALMDWLHEREKEIMCFPSLGKERLRRVARKLRKVSEK